MYISYDYYRVFYYVAKYGNVSQAAKLLLNNQPNLTRTIRNLESELGCPLFSRTNRGMKLTPEGERLYAHVRIAFEHIEAGEAELTEARNLQTGTVYIAAIAVVLEKTAQGKWKRGQNADPADLAIPQHGAQPKINAYRHGYRQQGK